MRRYVELGEATDCPVGNLKYTAMLMLEGHGKTEPFKAVQSARTMADLHAAVDMMIEHPHLTQPGGSFIPGMLEPPPDLPHVVQVTCACACACAFACACACSSRLPLPHVVQVTCAWPPAGVCSRPLHTPTASAPTCPLAKALADHHFLRRLPPALGGITSGLNTSGILRLTSATNPIAPRPAQLPVNSWRSVPHWWKPGVDSGKQRRAKAAHARVMPAALAAAPPPSAARPNYCVGSPEAAGEVEGGEGMLSAAEPTTAVESTAPAAAAGPQKRRHDQLVGTAGVAGM